MSLDTLPHNPIEPAVLPEKKSAQPVGPLVGIVIIMLLLIVGALYFWGEQLNKQTPEPSYIPGDQTAQ